MSYELPWVESMYLKLRRADVDAREAADLADVCARAVGQPMFCELDQPWADVLADIVALPEVAA